MIPKELRKRYSFNGGSSVYIIPMPDGVSIVPERSERRFIRRGAILAIRTGSKAARLEEFEIERLR